MRNINLLLFIVFCGVWGSMTAQQRGTFYTNGRTINIDTFNRAVLRMMDDIDVPGMSVAIIENNKVVFCNGYGLRKKGTRMKVDRRTAFHAASLSKSYLLLPVYQLVDEGKLNLDTPMYKYLPNPRLEYDPRYKLITPRMILSHSSGLENWQSQNDPSKLEIVSDPGTNYVYSGEGYNYLAQVLEKLLNEPYEEYIRQRVTGPLHLNNSYLKYKKKKLGLFHKEVPWNYAYGHGLDGKPMIFKSYTTFPASGNNITAEDYARLVIALFDTVHLSVARIKDLEQPIIRMENSPVFYGPGFEVLHTDRDLIVSHGGDFEGYKNLMYYSVPNKRGFVILVNSDKGKFLAERLSGMSVKMDLDSFLKPTYFVADQYPGNSGYLLKIFEEQGADAMFTAIQKLRAAGSLNAVTLAAIAYYFRWYDGGSPEIARKLLEENIAFYPDSSLSYAAAGRVFNSLNRPDSALYYLRKAKEMGFSQWDIDEDIRDSEKSLVEFRRRMSYLVKLEQNGQTIVRAENYNNMYGIDTEVTTDEGGGRNICSIDPGDWLEYRIDVPVSGNYSVDFRLASSWEGNEFELRMGDTVLTKVNVRGTGGWQNWYSYTADISLSAGEHTLKLNTRTGAFNINWLRFSLLPGAAGTARESN